MRKLTSWLLGFALGAALGLTLVMLFSPVTGQEIIDRVRQGWAETLEEARRANAERRAELEARLREMQQRKS